MSASDEARRRYFDAAHAVHLGIKQRQALDPLGEAVVPFNVTAAQVDVAVIAALLIAKGLISEAEWHEAAARAMEAEQRRYEQLLTGMLGREVKLP